MANHETLVVENVDLDLLEEQRLALARVIECAIKGRQANAGDLELSEGVQQMLDAWSDERCLSKGEVSDEGKA